MSQVVAIDTEERRKKLGAFLQLLRERGQLEFDHTSFDHRFKVQKYLFIAGFLGLDHGYSFSRYIHGPYCSSLANDYYAITPNPSKTDYASELGGFDSKRFLALVGNKGTRWLEIAATVLSVWQDYRSSSRGEEVREAVTRLVKNIKAASSEEIGNIYSELQKAGIIG